MQAPLVDELLTELGLEPGNYSDMARKLAAQTRTDAVVDGDANSAAPDPKPDGSSTS